MHKPTDQNAIDQKIHKFMARKSPGRTFSQSVAEHLTPVLGSKRSASSEIAYEPLEWHQANATLNTTWQKAH